MKNMQDESVRKHLGREESESKTIGPRDQEIWEVSMRSREQRVFSFKLIELIWLFFGAVEGMIGLRILLKLVAADPNNAFATFIYSVSDVFLRPFRGLTATPSAGGYVLELPAFVALLVYALLAWGIVRLVWILLYRPPDTRPPAQPRPA